MKKLIALLTVALMLAGLSVLVLAADSGEYTLNGKEMEMTTLGHPLVNTVDVTYTYNEESKTVTGTPNPKGPATDAVEAPEVKMKDGTSFRVHKGKVQMKEDGSNDWKTMHNGNKAGPQ